VTPAASPVVGATALALPATTASRTTVLATLGPTAFAALVWGSLALVGVVLAWQAWVLLGEWRRDADDAPGSR
jgi:hypothetical protein